MLKKGPKKRGSLLHTRNFQRWVQTSGCGWMQVIFLVEKIQGVGWASFEQDDGHHGDTRVLAGFKETIWMILLMEEIPNNHRLDV